jgi:CubicO group peptidase (beta-lactamase class C family)
MKKARWTVITLFVLVVMVADGFSQAGDAPRKPEFDGKKVRKTLDAMLPDILDLFYTPGFAVGILKDNKVAYARAFGQRDLDSGEPVTSHSLFHMGSVSKPFAATAIMQLKEKGKLALDDPLVKHLPYFEMKDQRYKLVTILHLLTHTSGLPDVDDYHWDKAEADPMANRRYIRGLKDVQFIADPGTVFHYSNMGYSILADVISVLSGQSYEEYIRTNILDPLEMTNSTFLKKDVSGILSVTPHKVDTKGDFSLVKNPVYPYHRAYAASSTLHSSVLEMLHWARANLNKGTYKKKKILNPDSYELLWKPLVKIGKYQALGLGWFMGVHRGVPSVGHGGGDEGFRCYFVMIPSQQLAVVVMANAETFQSFTVIRSILDVCLGLDPEPIKGLTHVELGRTLAKKGIDGAIQQYRRLKKEKANDYFFGESMLYQLGDRLLKAGKTKQAIAMLKLNIEEFPKSINSYTRLADAYIQNKEKKKAMQVLETGLQKNPGDRNLNQKLESLKAR